MFMNKLVWQLSVRQYEKALVNWGTASLIVVPILAKKELKPFAIFFICNFNIPNQECIFIFTTLRLLI